MLKEKLEKINLNHILCVILLILLILCSILLVQNNRMNRVIKHLYMPDSYSRIHQRNFRDEYNDLAEDYQRKMFELARLENEIIRRNEKAFYDDFDSFVDWNTDRFFNHMSDCPYRNRFHHNEARIIEAKQQQNQRNNSARNRNFIYNTRTETNKDGFVVRVKIPRIYSIDDVKVDFKNSNLSIKIEKQNNSKNKNEEFYSYSSFFENFLVPETKATQKDVKTTLNKENGNELTVVVPIIK